MYFIESRTHITYIIYNLCHSRKPRCINILCRSNVVSLRVSFERRKFRPLAVSEDESTMNKLTSIKSKHNAKNISLFETNYVYKEKIYHAIFIWCNTNSSNMQNIWPISVKLRSSGNPKVSFARSGDGQGTGYLPRTPPYPFFFHRKSKSCLWRIGHTLWNTAGTWRNHVTDVVIGHVFTWKGCYTFPNILIVLNMNATWYASTTKWSR